MGGLLLSTTGWSSIFLVNVPVGIISFVIGLRTLPNRSPEHPGTLDVPGSALLFSSLLLVVGSVTLMDVARTTVQAIHSRALAKVAAALVEGRELVIGGGDFFVCDKSEQQGCGRHA